MELKHESSCRLAGCLIGGLLVVIASVHLAEAGEARRIEQAPADAQLVVRSDFDVYLDDDNRLVYVKDECDEADVRQTFFLHLVPADHADLPDHRQQYNFDSLDFDFGDYGTLDDGRCIARRPLPGYDIAIVRTGQYVRGEGEIWQVRFLFKDYAARLKPYRSTYAAIAAGDFGEPVVRSVFDLYRVGNTLIYLKEPCGTEDVEARFFLHVTPRFIDELPARRRRSGFDNLDFSFPDYGIFLDGKCLAIGVLPDYEVVCIKTGQFVPGARRVWRAEIPGNEPSGDSARGCW